MTVYLVLLKIDFGGWWSLQKLPYDKSTFWVNIPYPYRYTYIDRNFEIDLVFKLNILIIMAMGYAAIYSIDTCDAYIEWRMYNVHCKYVYLMFDALTHSIYLFDNFTCTSVRSIDPKWIEKMKFRSTKYSIPVSNQPYNVLSMCCSALISANIWQASTCHRKNSFSRHISQNRI